MPEITSTRKFVIELDEREAELLSEALYVAISNKSLWAPTESALVLCDTIINDLGMIGQ